MAVLISAVALLISGLNLGIEFKGGVVWEFASKDITVTAVQDTMKANGLTEASVQTVTSQDSGARRIRVKVGPQTEAKILQVTDALQDLAMTHVIGLSIFVYQILRFFVNVDDFFLKLLAVEREHA